MSATPDQLAKARAEMDAFSKRAAAANKAASENSVAAHALASVLLTVWINDDANRGKEMPGFAEFLDEAKKKLAEAVMTTSAKASGPSPGNVVPMPAPAPVTPAPVLMGELPKATAVPANPAPAAPSTEPETIPAEADPSSEQQHEGDNH